MNAKKTGSYYTPIKLSHAMVQFILKRHKGKDLLEPSAGDGSFFHNDLLKVFKVDSIEFIKEKVEYIDEHYAVNSIESDFLKYACNCNKKYDVIIGNPPYINKRCLDKNQILYAEKLCKEFHLSTGIFNNLWVAFILGAIKLLKNNGAIFFVLPYEFLQVQYSITIRKFLEDKFNSIEIFVFEEKIFENIEQKVCLVYLTNKNVEPYIEYKVIENFNLEKPVYSNRTLKNKPLEKWTNSIVTDEEIELIKKILVKCTRIEELGKMSPGVVTGANKYFIIDNTFVKSKRIKRYVEPIISKSSYLKNIFLLGEDEFEMVSNKYGKVNLLKLNSYKFSKLPKAIKQYIIEGEEEKINKRFKCRTRNPWYRLPEDLIGDIVFFKRYHKLPRIIVNKKRCHTTDIGYNIKLNEKYDAESVAFCFYNSLTLCLCEYNGRFYGGGVAELTPNELRKVSIPYTLVNKECINMLNEMIKNNVDSETIISYVDDIVLSKFLSNEEISILRAVREKFLKRRCQSN